MRGMSFTRFALILSLLVAAATHASAGQGVVSTMRNVNAVMQARGFYLAPDAGSQSIQYPGDLAPVQQFQLVRPNWEKVTIGRLYTSCTCVRLEAPKRTFERGEPAVFTLRNVIATPPAGQRYAIYVQITSPIRTTLRYDTYVQSSQFVVSAPVEVIEPIVESKPEDGVAEATEEKKEDKEDLNAAESVAQDKQDEDAAHAEAKKAFEDKVGASDADKYSTASSDVGEKAAAEEKADAADKEEEAAATDKYAAAATDAQEEKEEAKETATPEPELPSEENTGDAVDAEKDVDVGDAVNTEDPADTDGSGDR